MKSKNIKMGIKVEVKDNITIIGMADYPNGTALNKGDVYEVTDYGVIEDPRDEEDGNIDVDIWELTNVNGTIEVFEYDFKYFRKIKGE